MADYKYTKVYGKLERVLEKIRSTGVPAKANADWLKSLGFTSSNDRSIPRVLKALGLIDSSNVPTPRWREYRGPNHRSVLGAALREVYAGLFELYPEACGRSDSELESYFRTQTDGGDQVVKTIVGTFKALCSLADTGGEVSLGADVPASVSAGTLGSVETTAPNQSLSPALHIDIQVHISAESSADQIDQIFRSMAKHLYKRPE